MAGVEGYAALVLAGGAGRRLGGVDKSRLPVGGRPMRDRVLDAVADARPRILVGPGPAPAGVLRARETPPGSGPVPATAAGLALLGPEVTEVALLAADLPLLTAAAVTALRARLAAGDCDGVCYRDDRGRRQQLCGVWRVAALRTALDRLRETGAPERDQLRDTRAPERDRLREAGAPELAGASMRALLAGCRVAELDPPPHVPPPWFDCDTPEDVRRAQGWLA